MADRYNPDNFHKPYELEGLPLTFKEAYQFLRNRGFSDHTCLKYLRDLWYAHWNNNRDKAIKDFEGGK